MSVTDKFMEGLVSQCGISTCFANPGTTEMGMLTSMGKLDMRTILCLHENVATGAADGYFRAARRPACTLLHLGPGLSNGLSNLHNAMRAKSKVVNIVGEMSTFHKAFDPPLASDIESLARTVSGHVRSVLPTADVGGVLRHTMEYLDGDESERESRVATLIMPHNCNWEPAVTRPVPAPPATRARRPADWSAFDRAVATVDAIVFPDAFFVRDNRDALATLYRSGVDILCKNNFACIYRGGGMPPITRIEYLPKMAKSQLSRYKGLVFVNTERPVAMFGYQDYTGDIVEEDAYVHTHINASTADVLSGILSRLPKTGPVRDVPVDPQSGALAGVIARAQPDGCIVVDESITFGKSYWDNSSYSTVAGFRHMGLTGGSIGMGPAVAVGAAVSSDSWVLNLQGDGSAAYTLPAFWTQARYKLPIVTVILANNRYHILEIEQRLQRLGADSSSVAECTDLSTNPINWGSVMTAFGIASSEATNADELSSALSVAFSERRPYCIILRT